MGTHGTHLHQVAEVVPSSEGGEDCLRVGGQWVHLRMCMSCGPVGGGVNAPNRHATAHFHARRPLIQSYERREDRRFCSIDDPVFALVVARSFAHP